MHWTPLSTLRGAGAVRSVRFEFGGRELGFPCFRVDGEPVWGLTYRIVEDLLERLASVPVE